MQVDEEAVHAAKMAFANAMIRWRIGIASLDGLPLEVVAQKTDLLLQEAITDYLTALEAKGLVIVPVELLRQVYGMAGEGCAVPLAADRWCERIDEVFHFGQPIPEYSDFAKDLPDALLSASKDGRG